MRIAAVNISDYGSTGKIMLGIAAGARKQGHDVITFSRKWFGTAAREGHIYFGLAAEHAAHHAAGFITGDEGSGSYISTLLLIHELERFAPDVLHLHNLHGWYINLPLLFSYIKKNGIKTLWTLHDCWAFTGHCPYFDYAKCSRWKNGCGSCPQYKMYPSSMLDNSHKMYCRKSKWFTGVADLTLVCPSRWLAEHVKSSFLSDYTLKVIHNGMDTDTFTYRDSDFRERHGIGSDETVILGVAFDWEKRKGIDVFSKLNEVLGDGYRTVLVGADASVCEGLPERAVCIPRTQDQIELAEIYSAADVFVNPSREDNYPTVNMEAISCGTPAAVFDTGGSAESVLPGCGTVVARDDIETLADAVRQLRSEKKDRSAMHLQAVRSFDDSIMTDAYLRLLEGDMDA